MISKLHALFLVGSLAFLYSCIAHGAPASKKVHKGKKADSSQTVTILDMSGPVEDDSALPTISKKGPL